MLSKPLLTSDKPRDSGLLFERAELIASNFVRALATNEKNTDAKDVVGIILQYYYGLSCCARMHTFPSLNNADGGRFLIAQRQEGAWSFSMIHAPTGFKETVIVNRTPSWMVESSELIAGTGPNGERCIFAIPNRFQRKCFYLPLSSESSPTEEWQEMPNTRLYRKRSFATVAQGRLVVTGSRKYEVEQFHFQSWRWKRMPSLNSYHDYQVVASIGDQQQAVIVCGGIQNRRESERKSEVYCFNSEMGLKQKWMTVKASLLTTKDSGGVWWPNRGQLIVAGGSRCMYFVQKYDPRQDTWMFGPSLNYPFGESVVTGLADGLPFVAGIHRVWNSKRDVYYRVQVLDDRDGEWHVVRDRRGQLEDGTDVIKPIFALDWRF